MQTLNQQKGRMVICDEHTEISGCYKGKQEPLFWTCGGAEMQMHAGPCAGTIGNCALEAALEHQDFQ